MCQGRVYSYLGTLDKVEDSHLKKEEIKWGEKEGKQRKRRRGEARKR